MRGKAVPPKIGSNIVRITPAYAGKSMRVFCVGDWVMDHPRLCGEKPNHYRQNIYHQGSPPPMRGKA